MADVFSVNEVQEAGFWSIEAATGVAAGDPFAVHGRDDVEAACAAAEVAFDAYRATTTDARADFLERIGAEIVALGDDLIVTAMRESGLPRARLEGERGRTVGQLKLFAGVVRRGGWMGVRIDPALPDRAPLPRPDRREQFPARLLDRGW
jgi:alpha-ketoglutaric semialdehyde dehydrogenase